MNIKRKIQGKLLNWSQKRISKAYEKHGLTDDILDKQIRINKKRHKHNIPEKEEYVQ